MIHYHSDLRWPVFTPLIIIKIDCRTQGHKINVYRCPKDVMRWSRKVTLWRSFYKMYPIFTHLSTLNYCKSIQPFVLWRLRAAMLFQFFIFQGLRAVLLIQAQFCRAYQQCCLIRPLFCRAYEQCCLFSPYFVGSQSSVAYIRPLFFRA